jgi:glycerol-3-phosphate acyltransferase PlsY
VDIHEEYGLMPIVSFSGLLLVSYLIGSIPTGLLIVRLAAGKDIRQVESGRTGGTNAMRAAGFWAGLATALLDMLKAAVTVWVAAVIGHNYSIFLAERTPEGKLRLRGGAGGAPTAGGALGLWPPSILFIIPVGALMLFGVGYASVATMSAPVVAALVFAYRAWTGAAPWEYVFYGVITEILLLIALRPNIQRLMNGTERLVGWRAKRARKLETRQHDG